ncbi:hypothetical protein AHX05_20110 [Salmonella enterica subsp. indica]|nr:hypothetical protein [Salmonella enterica subsp. indica]
MRSKDRWHLPKNAIRYGKVGDESSLEPLTNRFKTFLSGGAALNLPTIIEISRDFMKMQA